MKQICELHAEGHSYGDRPQAGLSPNSVRKYLRADEIPKAKPLMKRGIEAGPVH